MDFPEIVTNMMSRMRARSPLIRRCAEVKLRYDGEWIMPMPNMDEEPDKAAFGPALVAETVEYLALRASEQAWSIWVPALDSALDKGRGSIEWAAKRRKVMDATWARNQGQLAVRTAYKHQVGYATMAMLWMWDDEKGSRTFGMPRLLVRDPMCSFPDPKAPYDISLPHNIGFIAAHSAESIMAQWGERRPEVAALVSGARRGENQLWDLVEWLDQDDVVIGILGPHYNADGGTRQDWTSGGGWAAGSPSWQSGRNMELWRYPNKAGCVPAVCPSQVTMSKVASAVSRNLGQADLMNRMLALDIAASERDVFPDRYVLGEKGGTPKLIGHTQWQDGRTGNTNLVSGAREVNNLHNQPSQAARQLTSVIERNFRVSTGLVPAAGGETYGALRTGRGIDSMLGTATDPRVAELQEMMEFALTEMNRGMLGLWRGNAESGRKIVLFSGRAGDASQVEFIADMHLESDEQVVAYPVVGMSVQDLTIELGQLFAAKAISLRTFRLLHPHIKDAEAESSQVYVEMLELAAIDSLAKLVENGMMPPEDLVAIGQKLKDTGNIFEAVRLQGDLAQKRQASAAPPPGELGTGPNGEQLALPPGTQPGLGPAGAGMEQQPSPLTPEIGPPAASIANLHSLVRDLRTRV